MVPSVIHGSWFSDSCPFAPDYDFAVTLPEGLPDLLISRVQTNPLVRTIVSTQTFASLPFESFPLLLTQPLQ